MKDVEKEGCIHQSSIFIWIHPSLYCVHFHNLHLVVVNKGRFPQSSKTIEIVTFLLQSMNWSHALGRFSRRTTIRGYGIHMC